ncbi:uncharacterized protein [Nicotiana sylvestris]|uniref:uncharacterized protein n=1 Tax=Nicotiana sylvestris TaxID=4096 RepID=UPI00388C9519
MITALVAQPPTGEGQTGRGRPRGGGQTGRGHPATAQSGGGQPDDAPSRFYAIPARPDALASDAIITGIISVCGRGASVLFDPGSTYSYVSSLFAHFLDIPHLLLLDMTDFEVILGMDWLSPYHVVLDCHAKIVTLAMPELPRLEWKGSLVNTSSRVISFLKDRHMVETCCLAYLDYVRDTTVESLTIDSVTVVRECVNVFPSDLPGMPPDCDIDLCIDLAPGNQHLNIDDKQNKQKT